MNIGHARAIYLLLIVKLASSEVVFEWSHVTKKIGDELCKFRATSFEYADDKFYLTLVDKNKRTPGVGYVAWFSPGGLLSHRQIASDDKNLGFLAGDDRRPNLYVYGDKDDYRLFNRKGHIMAPMLVRADPCGDIWVMDANMYDISGEQAKAAPAFHIYEQPNGKHIFRDIEWNEKSVFLNIVFEVHQAVQEKNSKQRCDPLVAYLADANHFNLIAYHYHEDTSRKYSHPIRIPSPYKQLPNGYPGLLKGRQLRGIKGLTFISTEKFGPLLLFHVLGGTTEYVIPLEHRKNESILNEKDIRVEIEKGSSSEAGRTAYDPVTGTLFFAEVKSRQIGFLNIHTALQGNQVGSTYRRFDIRLMKGIITDMKVIGQDLWVLTSSESRITLEREPISGIIHDHKRRASSTAKNAICEMLECTQSAFLRSKSNEFYSNFYLLIICSFLFLL